jgi:hypothetical protein
MRGEAFERYQQKLAETRIDNWLWLMMRFEGAILPLESFGKEDTRRFLINSLSGRRVHELLRDFAGRRILPINQLEWITDDERQINWLRSYFKNIFKLEIDPPPGLIGRGLIVTCIDLLEVDLEDKSRAIAQMNRDWHDYLKTDIIFKWFKGQEEAARCEFAWDWIMTHKQTEARGQPPISNFRELLKFFDSIEVNEAQKKLDVAAIKRKWSQQKYRESMKGKSQYNFVLTDRVIAELDKLASRYEASRPQIIEALIDMEAIQGTYLPQKIKKISFN